MPPLFRKLTPHNGCPILYGMASLTLANTLQQWQTVMPDPLPNLRALPKRFQSLTLSTFARSLLRANSICLVGCQQLPPLCATSASPREPRRVTDPLMPLSYMVWYSIQYSYCEGGKKAQRRPTAHHRHTEHEQDTEAEEPKARQSSDATFPTTRNNQTAQPTERHTSPTIGVAVHTKGGGAGQQKRADGTGASAAITKRDASHRRHSSTNLVWCP